ASVPPLSRLEALVAALCEETWERRARCEELVHAGALGAVTGVVIHRRSAQTLGTRRLVARDEVLARVEPGDDRRERWRAETRRHVAALENDAFVMQPFEARRADHAVGHGAINGPRLTVRDNQH